MSQNFTQLTSITPLFLNFSNMYNYTRLPKTDDDDEPSQIEVTQDFASASPAVYKPLENWFTPTESVSGVLTDLAVVNLDNIFNTSDADNVIGIISGNITWDAKFDSSLMLQLTTTIPNFNFSTTLNIVPGSATYYIYVLDTNVNKSTFSYAVADYVNIEATIVDATGTAVTTNFSVASTYDNWEYTELTHETRHVGTLHAYDFAVGTNSRTLIFDGTVIPPAATFNQVKSAVVELDDVKTIRSYLDLVSWPVLNTTVTGDTINTTYEITSWQIVDGRNTTDATYNNNHYYTISHNVGDITCTPNYKTTTTTTTTTIYPNVKWTWSHANTANANQSGTFGGAYYSVGSSSATTAKVVVDAYVSSANDKSTKTGINSTWLTSVYKGARSVSNQTINVPIVNGQIYVYGIWYLQKGSANYLHPGYNNWHNGSGWLLIKSITY